MRCVSITINKKLTMLRQMFGRAVAWGKIRQPPMGDMQKIREPGRIRVLSEAEEARLPACCNQHLRDVVTAALDAGFRKSDLLVLPWHDID